MGRHYQKAWHCIRSCRQLRLAVIRQSDAVMTSLFPSVTVLPSVFSENDDDSSVCSLLWMTLVENRVNSSVLIQLKQYHLKCLHVYVKNASSYLLWLFKFTITLYTGSAQNWEKRVLAWRRGAEGRRRVSCSRS